jgi:two-component system chemotaxis sensor kinase CheA
MSATDRGVVHVDLSRLDKLLTLVGELVIARTALVDQARRARALYGFKEQVLDLLETTEKVGRIGEEIQGKVIKARMVPVGSIFRRFEGLVAELSGKTDKEIALEILGERTEVDKRTIDQLAEPLVHLVRNALDHGIEPAAAREAVGKSRRGVISLEARHEGNRLVVEVKDDGAGVNLDLVRERAVSKDLLTEAEAAQLSEEQTLGLLFQAGFSTSREVTGLSGRGVGLDAAKRRVEALGGTLTMATSRGAGSSSRIELPLTTAIVEALIVGVRGEAYALPLEHVEEIVRIRLGDISTVEGREVLDLRGMAVSLAHLAALVGLPARVEAPERAQVVIVRFGEQELGLVVDRILERHEIVIKALGRRLAGTRGSAGASITGDGKVVMVLDVATMCDDAASRAAGRDEA